MSSPIGLPVTDDLPKLPRTMSPMNSANCCANGRCRPISRYTRSYRSCGARSPTTRSTGSAGNTRPSKNVTSSSPASVISTVARVPASPRTRRRPALGAGGGAGVAVAWPPGQCSFLLDDVVVRRVEGHAAAVVLHVLAHRNRIVLLHHEDERRIVAQHALQVAVALHARRRIDLARSLLGLDGQLRNQPVVAPGGVLVGNACAVVGVAREELDGRARVRIIPPPKQHHHLVT